MAPLCFCFFLNHELKFNINYFHVFKIIFTITQAKDLSLIELPNKQGSNLKRDLMSLLLPLVDHSMSRGDLRKAERITRPIVAR